MEVQSQQAPFPSPLLIFTLPWLGPLTLIDGAVERFLIREFGVEAVLGVVGSSSVGVTVPTDLGPLVGQGLRASIGKALQYHIVALGHVAFGPAHGYGRTCCNKAGNYKPRPSQKTEPGSH